MELKKIFRPTAGTVVLFLILLIATNYYSIATAQPVFDGYHYNGYPLGFLLGSGSGPFLRMGQTAVTPENVIWMNLAIDIVFWYLVSCAAMLTYRKIAKK